MIQDKRTLHEYLKADSKKYKPAYMSFYKYYMHRMLNETPISDQYWIWRYIYCMRHVEYHLNISKNKKKSNVIRGLHRFLQIVWNQRLRRASYITSFQIAPNTCGPGLTIWHWGPIIINAKAKIGKNVTIYPGVLIGHKTKGEGAPFIGDNVFIGAGAKIIGNIKIGDNVIIGHNIIVTKDVDDDTIIVQSKYRIL